jgi:uncharacterized protein
MAERKRIFLGRERQLEMLRDLLDLRIASLVVLKGRRRIGKSRLAEEFGKSLKTLSFLGLAPEEHVTAQTQRKHFVRQLQQQLNIGGLLADDWDDLFYHLAHRVSSGRIVIIFDEINWMGSKDPTFLPKLKTAWDMHFSKNPELILILSGSMSGWIERNILSSTGFFGRINLDMTLKELPLHQCAQFWGEQGKHLSTYEKFKVLSVIGGVPRYLELIKSEQSAEQNIDRLCFKEEGMLFNEYDRIFSDLFSRKSTRYKRMVEQLVQGPASKQDILRAIGEKPGGISSAYLDDLVKTGYLARDYRWEPGTTRRTKLSRYRLCDNYLRFYLHYIEPRRETILQTGQVEVPQWHSIMGLQFENLVLNNRPAIYKMLGIKLADFQFGGPYFQTTTEKRRGCQVDLLIQTRSNTLYVCEIKFKKGEVGSSVIGEIEEKIKRLQLPRGYSIRPVLIHVNGVTHEVAESGFFSHIIDFGQLLHASP